MTKTTTTTERQGSINDMTHKLIPFGDVTGPDGTCDRNMVLGPDGTVLGQVIREDSGWIAHSPCDKWYDVSRKTNPQVLSVARFFRPVTPYTVIEGGPDYIDPGQLAVEPIDNEPIVFDDRDAAVKFLVTNQGFFDQAPPPGEATDESEIDYHALAEAAGVTCDGTRMITGKVR